MKKMHFLVNSGLAHNSKHTTVPTVSAEQKNRPEPVSVQNCVNSFALRN